jgi:hypothetical protein
MDNARAPLTKADEASNRRDFLAFPATPPPDERT